MYRKDGTLFSEGNYKDVNAEKAINETKYNHNGTIREKSYQDSNENLIQERYSQNGCLFVRNKLDSNNRLIERTVFNDDTSVYFTVKYDTNGKVIDYKKFKNTNNHNHDKFDNKALNGKIDTKYDQGYTGICYFAGTIKSMLETEEGAQIIDEAYDYDFENETATIEFEGYNKSYTFTKEEIIVAMGRLGTGDPDFTALSLGWEKLRTETEKKCADSGQSNDVFFAFTGKKGDSNLSYFGPMGIRNENLDYLQNKMKQGSVAVTAGTLQLTVDTEMSEDDTKNGIINNHMYSILEITDKNVKVFDPRTGKNRVHSREVFLQKFEYYSTFDFKSEN